MPTEGLYAEMMARPGFADTLQREQRVLLCGPMNLAALLNSLQMGFRTLAIEQRSSEVWKILGAVKTEFHRFGDVLAKTKDKIDQASRTIEDAGVRTRAIERHLREVESLPEHEATRSHRQHRCRRADDGAGDALTGAGSADARVRLASQVASRAGAPGRGDSRRAVARGLRHAAVPRPYDADEIDRLRALVVLFLDAKAIVGARGHEVTPLQRVIIAIQACVLMLEPRPRLVRRLRERHRLSRTSSFPGWEYEDEAGVVHRQEGPLAGEAMPQGPVTLSWPDVAASADWDAAGMNLVIHEFAHKIDMSGGDANGCPPLPPGLSPRAWTTRLDAAYEHFRARVQLGRHTHIDPYAAESPAEFFAVLAEVFFADPLCFRREYRGLYELYVQFFRQDPAAQAGSARGRRSRRRRPAEPSGRIESPARARAGSPRRGSARRRRAGAA